LVVFLAYAKQPCWEADRRRLPRSCSTEQRREKKKERERERGNIDNYIKTKTFHLLLTVQPDLTRVALVTLLRETHLLFKTKQISCVFRWDLF
jgi:phosphopantetheinyl transferase